MKRHVLNLLTALSLMLLAAAVVLWARGGGPGNVVDLHCGAHRLGISSAGGCLAVAYAHAPSLAGKGRAEVRWFQDTPFVQTRSSGGPLAAMGFRRGECFVGRAMPLLGNLPHLGRVFTSGVAGKYVQLPWWPLVIAAAALPSVRLSGAWRRRRRKRRGLCPCCAYDLRASPGRCPECGTPTATAERVGSSAQSL